MRILVNGMFGRNYRFVEVNVALFVNKTINLAFGSGESFDFTLLFDRLLQSIQIMAFQKLLHRSPVFDIDALTLKVRDQLLRESIYRFSSSFSMALSVS